MTWDIGPEKFDKVILALRKNLGFQMFSPRTRRWKNFVHRKVWPPSTTTSPIQLSNKQMDPTNIFVETERQN